VLGQNYPNPFNPVTVIPFSLAEDGRVRLRVYDAMGRLVAFPLDEMRESGQHDLPFAAGDLRSGSYYYSLEVDGVRQTRKMMILK